MLLIGLFTLALALLMPAPAHAEPVSLILLATIGIQAAAGSVIAAVTTFILTTVASLAISYIASSLLRSSAKPQTFPGTGTPVIDNKLTISQGTAPRQLIPGEARVGGKYALVHAQSNKHLHLVIVFAGHKCHMPTQFWIGDEAFVSYENRDNAAPGDSVLDADGFVTTGQYAGIVRVRWHDGDPDQLADEVLMAEAPEVWTSDHRLRGLAYATVRLDKSNPGAFASGIPNITAVIKGKLVFDPRTDTTAWSSNAALCVADYLCDPLYGPGEDYATGIADGALVAAANVCDEAVDRADGGIEARYLCNGSTLCSETPQNILGRLLGSMRGKAPFDGERWKIMAGVYQIASLSFSDNDLAGRGPKLQTIIPRRDRFNAVKGTFISVANYWQEGDFPPVKSAAYAAADGETIWKDITLPFVFGAAQAQRIAKIDLLEGRQEKTCVMTCKLTAWRAQAGDTITWTSARYGWVDKPFEVTKVGFSVNTDGTLVILLYLRETDPSVYDWNTDEETPVDPHPGTDLPDPSTVLPPTNLTVTEEVYSTGAGSGVKSRLLIDWDPSPDGFLIGYQVEMKLQSVTDWDQTHILGRTATTETHWTVDDVAVGYYHVRVAAINTVERRSTFIQESVTVSGDTSPPADVTGFVQTAGVSGFSRFYWGVSVEERVLSGGSVEIRYEAVTSGATWATATLLFIGAGGSANAVLETLIGTYLIKFRSSTGVYSVNAATVVITTVEQIKVGVDITGSLPATDLYDGRIVYLTSDGKLYRYDAGIPGWTAAVPTTDLTGQISDAQIEEMSAAKILGQIADAQIEEMSSSKLLGDILDSQIAAVAAAKLTGTITTTQIADDSISTPKLKAAAVEANNLAANSVTAVKILAGAVTTDKLAASSITAEKMVIGSFDNNVANSNFVNGLSNWGQLSVSLDNWIPTQPSDTSLVTGAGGYAGSQHVIQFAATYDFASDGPLYNSSFFAVTAGEKYLLRTATQRVTGGGTHTRNLIIELQFFRYDTATSAWIGVSPVDGSYTQALDTDPGNTWVVRDSNTYHGTDNITVPATATRARVVVYSESGGATGGIYWLGLVSVFKRNPASLIVDGGIIAQTIATDAVTTNKVQAGAITAAKISVSQLSAISADVGSLTAGTLTGLTIRTGSGTTRVEISSSGSFPNAITAYVSGTAVATFGGNVPNGDGFIQVAGSFSLIYPARFINTSTTGGGSATGGGAAFLKSEGGWTLQVDQVSTSAGTGNRTVTARITNIGAGGGGLEIGAAAGDGGFAAYAFSGTYTPFTGSHDSLMDKAAPVPEVGDLMVTVDTVAVSISDTMPVVALSSEPRQPAICGAFLNRRPADPDKPPSAMMEDYTVAREIGEDVWIDVYPPVPEWGPLTGLYDVVFFNGVGEGGVNACNQNGDIEPGDLLCSSSIPGKVMRQGDDVVHSYTVGKAMGRTTFSGPDDFRMIGVFYTSG